VVHGLGSMLLRFGGFSNFSIASLYGCTVVRFTIDAKHNLSEKKLPEIIPSGTGTGTQLAEIRKRVPAISVKSGYTILFSKTLILKTQLVYGTLVTNESPLIPVIHDNQI
jgi:hypothetical protein